MIGRGDLGVEIPFEELPYVQKYLVTECRLLGKRVITATEMLESMINNPRPTRAEISDVANAVYDGTSAVMLSGETAAGKYPVEAVATMGKIAEETEKHIHYVKRFRNTEFHIKNTVDAISHATCGMAIDLDARVIVACTLTGITARMISRFRPPMDIIGLTTDRKAWYKLSETEEEAWRRREYLERCLQLLPEHGLAKERLQSLNPPAAKGGGR